MAQFNWTYVNDAGKHNVVGIYHGNSSGHLVVYCNGEVVQIDFNVRQSKTYSLFIDDELLELKLERKGDKFYYKFEINKEADTPKNRQRIAFERKGLKQSLLLLAFCVLLLTLAIVGFQWYGGSQYDPARRLVLSESPVRETKIKVFPRQISDLDAEFNYSFVADGKVIEGVYSMPVSPVNYMPIDSGNEFIVEYDPLQPEDHFIDFNRPSPNLLAIYRQMAIEKHSSLHPELSPQAVACLVDVGYSLKGTKAYTAFFRQEEKGMDTMAIASLLKSISLKLAEQDRKCS